MLGTVCADVLLTAYKTNEACCTKSMSDLPLIVNSTDTALLSSNAVPSVGTNDLASGAAKVEGFAAVLGRQVMPGEGATASESPPPSDGTRNLSAIETGERPPLDGKALPPVVTEAEIQPNVEFPDLEGSLISVVVPDIPLLSVNQGNAQMGGTVATDVEPGPLTQDALLRAAVQQVTLTQAQPNGELSAQSANGGGAPLPLQNAITNPQATVIAAQNNASTLSSAAQDAQRAATLPPIPAMLGKSISSTAEEALQRASLNAGKAQYFQTGLTTPAGQAGVTTQGNPVSPGTFASLQNLMGSTQRVDMFNAVMGGIAQTDTQSELRLTTNAVPANLSNSSISTTTLPDGSFNLSADAGRLPNVTGNGVASQISVSTPVGQPAWASELGQRVTWLANNELREAKLQLHPRSLGAVEVRIAYGHEQQMHVSFSAANPIARDALEASLPRLREMFEQQGLNLGDANISQEPPSEQQHDNNMTNGPTMSAEGYVNIDESIDTDGLQPPTHHWLGEGMLNAYA